MLCACFAVFSFAGIAQDSKENADFKLAINLYNDGLYDLATEQLRQFVNAYPTTAQGIEARFYLGLTQMKLKKYDDARITFQTFALNYQDNQRAPEAWYRTGEAFVALNNAKEAALAFERVKVFYPKSKQAPEALLQASKFFLTSGNRDDAKRVLRIILQEYASSPAVLSARTQLGSLYFDEGNVEQAQNELKRVIEGDPSAEAKAQALLILGNINMATRRNALARANYEEIITKYKTSPAGTAALVNLGKVLASEGRAAEALEHFRKALAAKGGLDSTLMREALLGIAGAQTAQKDFAGATASYDKFLSAYPADERTAQVLWSKSLTAARAKKYAASNDACQHIMKLQGNDLLRKRAQIRIGRNAEEQQNFAAAVQAYQTFVDQNPDDPNTPDVLMMVGRLYEERLRDPRKAATAYEQLTTRYPRANVADAALVGAARCHEALKEPDRALEAAQDLLSRFPVSEWREEALRLIRQIEIFEKKNNDSGVEKLALLVGDVVSDKDRPGLAYRLGEIYFKDMKNYEAAAAQFSTAINSGMTDPRFVDALYLRSRSYEYLTLKDESFRQRAIESYNTFVQAYPADARTPGAALSLFFLKAVNPTACRNAQQDAAVANRRDTTTLHMASLLEKSDSLSEALAAYEAVAQEFPDTPSGVEAMYRSAMIFLHTHQTDSAYAWGQAYLARSSTGAHAAEMLQQLADVASKRGDHAAAVEFLQTLAAQYGYTATATGVRARLAEELSAAGNHADAAALYAEIQHDEESSVLSEGGVSPSTELGLARTLHLAGKNTDAKAALLDLLTRMPDSSSVAEAYTLLGWIARDEGSPDQATAYFEQAENAKPGSAATREIADLLFANGKYENAAKTYAALASTADADTSLRYYMAQIILSKLKNDDVAGIDREIEAFQTKFGADETTTAAFRLERGNSLFRKEDYPAALTVFTEVAKKYGDTPSGPTAQYWIGKAQQAMEKPADAIATMEGLIQDHPLAPIIARAHLTLGNLYYEMEKWPESIRHYRVITDDSTADPTLLPYAMSNLIETYELAGVYDAALAMTRKYVEMYPNAEDCFDKRIKIGILYSHLGYYDQAVMHLQGLLDQAGSDLEGEIRYYIAEANYNKGDYQQAILDFLKIPYLVTKKGKIDWTANSLYMSGQSYEKMGKYDQALTMYRQIVDRTGIDETFKAAAKKEIDRVKTILNKKN